MHIDSRPVLISMSCFGGPPTQFPFSLPAVRNLTSLEFHPKVTFFVGDNGTGKSTLLEAIAVNYGMNPEGGGRNFNFGTRESHSDLFKSLRLARSHRRAPDAYFLRAESYFNLATEIERLDQGSHEILSRYGGKSLHEQSHGEAFLKLFEFRFTGDGLYILDEPEAALSPMSQLSLLSLMHQLIQRGAQFLIATHSPIIMAYPDAWIYHFSKDGIRKTAYEDTEHFKVTRAFLTRPKKMLDVLLGDE